MTDFRMPASFYEPPESHECDDGDDCQCAERDDDLREDALLHRQEEEQGR